MSNIEDDIKKLNKFNEYENAVVLSEEALYEIQEAIEHILSEREQDKARIKELKEENGKLRIENAKLRVVRVEYEYGYENTHFITKNNLVQIDRNKYLIEVKEGKFVDIKQLYYDSIPKQKVKGIVKQIQEEHDKVQEQFNFIWNKKSKDNYDRYKLQELSAMQQELGFILGKFEELLEEGE